MKNFLPAFLPALALLALSGCASTSGLATSEDDGVYYSSKDHTTATAPSYQGQGYANQGYNNQGNAAAGGSYNQPQQATPQTQTDEAANPDYNYNTNGAGGAIQNNSGNSQYYDNSYQGSGNSAYNQGYTNGYSNGLYSSSYYAPGVAYYSPLAYAPYTSLGYGYGNYGWGGGYCGYSPYGYSSFYNPYGYGYGSGLSISFGYGGYYGSPYGYGYGNPYSYYGYGYGNPYRYGSYYGYGGGYDPYYGYGYGGRNVIYTGSGHYSGSGNGNTVLVGPRRGRGGDVVTGGRPAGPATTGNSPVRTGGRTAVTEGGIVAPGGVGSTGGRASNPNYSGGGTAPALNNPGRGRTMESTQSYNAPATMPETAVGGGRIVRQQNLQPSSQPSAQPSSQSLSDERQPASYGNGRTRNFENAPMGQVNTQPAPQTMPQGADAQPTRRGGFFGGGGQGNQQPQRNYEQPQQRSYEQPQRSYEQPQRSESRSFGGGGGGNFGGGGNSGGGGGGGRRGR